MTLFQHTTAFLDKIDSAFARLYPNRLVFVVACVLLGFLCVLFLLASLGFLLHIPITPLHLPFALCVSFIPLFLAKDKKLLVNGAIITLGICVLSLVFSGLLYDYSYDGRAYHQTGVLYLANGWNPVWQKMADVIALSPYLKHEIAIEHYFKFSEVVAGCFFSTFSWDIELGKAINFIAVFGVFFYSISVMSKFINPLPSAILSFFASFSPVVVSQIATYYVDGLLSCALLVAFLAIIDREFYRRKIFIDPADTVLRKAMFARSLILSGSLIVIASVKLTGIAYAGFIGIGYLLYLLWFYPIKESRSLFLLGLSTGVLVLLCNANPILTNLAQGKHFGYPLLGKEKADIITGQQPKLFDNLNSANKLFYSLFSRTQNCGKQCDPVLKIPFSHLSDERPNIDTRIAGFGAYFSGALLLSVLMIILLRQTFRRKEILGISLLLIGSVLINPEAWWARYAPQMYFLPILVLGVSYYLCKKSLGSLLRIALMLTIVVNCVFYIINPIYHGFGYKRFVTKQIEIAKKSSSQEHTIYIYSDDIEHSFLYKLEQAQIPFTRLSDKNSSPIPLYVVPSSLGGVYWSIKQ